MFFPFNYKHISYFDKMSRNYIMYLYKWVHIDGPGTILMSTMVHSWNLRYVAMLSYRFHFVIPPVGVWIKIHPQVYCSIRVKLRVTFSMTMSANKLNQAINPWLLFRLLRIRVVSPDERFGWCTSRKFKYTWWFNSFYVYKYFHSVMYIPNTLLVC